MEQHQLPRARHIILIILLGAFGLIGTISYLSWDMKTSAYRSERWAIQSPSGMVDTLHIVIHPQSMVLPVKGGEIFKPDQQIAYNEVYFTYNIPFLIWMVLVAVTVACALALLPVVLASMQDIYIVFDQKPKNIWRAVLLTVLIGGLMVLTNRNQYVLMLFMFMEKSRILLVHPYAIKVFMMIGLLVWLASMCGQLLINESIGALPEDLSQLDINKQNKAADDFALLRNGLKFFLSVNAALIVLSILATDTLRRAIIQEVLVTGTNKDGIFSKEFIYMYGMIFTLYLALFYLPIYYRLRSKGAYMAQSLPDTDDNRKMNAKFVITETPIESFKTSLSILAPILSALLPGIIKF